MYGPMHKRRKDTERDSVNGPFHFQLLKLHWWWGVADQQMSQYRGHADEHVLNWALPPQGGLSQDPPSPQLRSRWSPQ